MKNFKSVAIGVGTVVAGVMLAGYLMNTFRDNEFVKDVRDGF